MIGTGIIGVIASLVVGAGVAAVTVVGVVTHTVDGGSSHPGNVAQTTIQYGSTK
jgi:hypothetical protein